MRKFLLILSAFTLAANAQIPQTSISNGIISAQIYLPDAVKGYYRGTRFDWSGVIGSLHYKGHNYYGPWFTKIQPDVHDFIFSGPDIIAGACSAAVGPVEEFSSDEPLGYADAKPGQTFIKIGVGVLRKPDNQKYDNYRLYQILDSGKWMVYPSSDSVKFVQQIEDPSASYSYLYTKTVRLVPGKPEMVIEHSLKNIGKRAIRTSVFDHNFLVLDKQPVGPNFTITVPFTITTNEPPDAQLAAVEGKRILYKRPLQGKETVAVPIQGFGSTAADYSITIENKKVGAGVKVTGDRPLAEEALWSIRSVVAMEPFVGLSIEPGREFTWAYRYSYYLLP
ncbi:MAG TPA: hypothetical protein VLI55_01605 [Bryobacteraceae bacterium]|nr:hypothetical protein [Bryobacteraceae bacterium]